MASLTLYGANELAADDGNRLTFTADSTPQTLSRLLDDVPANFNSMDSLNWTLQYAQSGRVDDTLDLNIRIMNGTTVLAAADNTGTFQGAVGNITNTIDQSAGPTAFSYVNTTADAATWNGASIQLQQVITPSMKTDGCLILVDLAEMTGEYTGSEQITHTTDANVGLFVAHTTDTLISEYDRPTDTQRSITGGASTRHKIGVDSNGTVWMVGVGTGATPSTVRLWEGPATGPPGFWQLHEFNHGSGTTRDVQLAIVGSTVHIIYMNHSGSNIRTYHIEWPIGGSSFTNNGTFGVSETHSDINASINNAVDLVATSDGELVAYCQLSSYVSWPPYNTYRFRKRIYRSSSLSFSTGTLQSELYGPNIFDRPSPQYPVLYPAQTDAYISEGNRFWRFDSSGTLQWYYSGYPSEGRSLPYLRAGRANPSLEGRIDTLGSEWATQVEGTVYTGPTTSYFVQGLAFANTGGDEILWDRTEFIYETTQPDANRDFYVLADHYGDYVIMGHDSAQDKFYTYVSNGLGTWFENQYLSSTLTPWLVPNQLVDRSIAAWHINSTGDWQYVGTTITTWYRAHTTDVVIVSADALIYHTTDVVIRSDMWGRPTGGSGNSQPNLRVWNTYNSKYYMVMGEQFSPIHIFESTTLENYGTKITSWRISDISGNNFLEQFVGNWDFVLDSSGVFHFLFQVYDNFTWQVLYWTYTISTNTWANNGSIYTSATKDHSQTNSTLITQRADGALIALFNEDFNWNYAINTGSGFGSAVSLATSTGSEAAMAVDGNNTHFLVKTGTNLYHWRLSPTDVLSARQGPVAGIDSMVDFPGSAKALIQSNTMYFPSINNQLPQVTDAATGSDAPTWTKTQISAKTTTKVRVFVTGVNGEPVFIFIEAATWKIWRVRLEGGSWVEEDTGQVVNLRAGQIDQAANPDNFWFNLHTAYAYPTVDANGFAWISWQYEARDFPADLSWHLLKVNLNPLEWHTTDAVLIGREQINHTTDVRIVVGAGGGPVEVGLYVPGQQLATGRPQTHTSRLVYGPHFALPRPVVLGGAVATVEHDTDAYLVDRLTVVHTTDAIISAGIQIEHYTDARIANQFTVTHTTDALISVRIDHSTDAVIVLTPHDLSTTINLNINITDGLAFGSVQPATGLGVHERGDHRKRIYNPDHRIIRKN